MPLYGIEETNFCPGAPCRSIQYLCVVTKKPIRVYEGVGRQRIPRFCTVVKKTMSAYDNLSPVRALLLVGTQPTQFPLLR